MVFQLIILVALLILLILVSVNVTLNWANQVMSVPSGKGTLNAMLKAANLKEGETIHDLGCGNGKLLFKAEKEFSTKGVGYEITPLMFLWAKIEGWIRGSNASFHLKNFFKVNLKDARKIFIYLSPEANKKLIKKIQKECKKGTLIISNTFSVPGMKPHKKFIANKDHYTVYVYKI